MLIKVNTEEHREECTEKQRGFSAAECETRKGECVARCHQTILRNAAGTTARLNVRGDDRREKVERPMSPAFDEAAGFSNEFGGVLGKAGACAAGGLCCFRLCILVLRTFKDFGGFFRCGFVGEEEMRSGKQRFSILLGLIPCDEKTADSRIELHCSDAVESSNHRRQTFNLFR